MLKLIPLRKGFLVAGIKIQIAWKWFPVSKFEYGPPVSRVRPVPGQGHRPGSRPSGPGPGRLPPGGRPSGPGPRPGKGPSPRSKPGVPPSGATPASRQQSGGNINKGNSQTSNKAK